MYFNHLKEGMPENIYTFLVLYIAIIVIQCRAGTTVLVYGNTGVWNVFPK